MGKFFKFGCLGIIAIVVLVIILAAIGGGGDDSADTGNSTSNSSSDKKKEEKKVETVGLGQELEVNKVFFKASEISRTNNIGGEYGVNAQSSFLVVNVEVRNDRDEAITIDDSFFKLKADGKTYDSDSSAGIYANENADFFFTSINPGNTLKGKVVFDVSEGLENIQMQVQTGMFGTETGVIDLK